MMIENNNFENKEFITAMIKKNPDAIFSSEPSYSTFFSQLYPQAQNILIDPKRKNLLISGTLIRNLQLQNAISFLPKSYKLFYDNKDVKCEKREENEKI